MINVTYRRKDLSANLYKKEPYKTRSRPLFGGLLNDVYRALQAAGDGTQMWSGFAEVGVDEGDLFIQQRKQVAVQILWNSIM